MAFQALVSQCRAEYWLGTCKILKHDPLLDSIQHAVQLGRQSTKGSEHRGSRSQIKCESEKSRKKSLRPMLSAV